MRTALLYCFVIYHFVCSSQSICDGIVVMPVESFSMVNTSDWVLSFEDNFDGSVLDTAVWKPMNGVVRDPYFENSKHWYKAENIVVNTGVLDIHSQKESLSNLTFDIWIDNGVETFTSDFEFTSGEIISIDYFSFGLFEARIKIPDGKGFWPAFWLFGQQPIYNEIDIFEFWDNKPKKHRMNAYCGQDNGTIYSCATKYNGDDFSDDFHVFSLIWTPFKISWLVDGDVKREIFKYYSLLGQGIDKKITAWQPVIMNLGFPEDPMQIILNTAVQNGKSSPDESTNFPGKLTVDWVRYYSK